MLLIVFAILVAGIVGVWYCNYFYYQWHLKMVPAPDIWPLLGNLPAFWETDKQIANLNYHMHRFNANSIRIHMLFQTLVITKDYKVVEHLLGSQSLVKKGFEYDFLVNWLGLSILTTSGQAWRSRRKMLIPTFHFQILEQFLNVFNSNAAILVKKLEKKVGMDSVDVHPLLSLCTLDIICETAMGTSVNAQLDENSEYVRGVTRVEHILTERIFNPLLHPDWVYKLTALGKEEQQILKFVHGYHNSMIRNRRQKFTAQQKLTEANNAEDDDLGRKKRLPLLDLLLQSTLDGQPLSDEEIGSEVSTFMFAGHDTTAAAMSFAMFELSKNRDIQEKAFQELYNIFGDEKRSCTFEDIQEMKYLELVIKETLRLYPAVPMFSRRIVEELTIDGIQYPAGTTISIFSFGIHRDEEHYENPEKFDPERFSQERSGKRKPFAYIPFSAGPRNCIGQKYAMLEMKAVLSTLLRHFELHPAKPKHTLNLIPKVTLRSSNGVKIAMSRRQY